MGLKFTNFARAQLAVPPSGTGGLSFTVAAGKGALFPSLGAGDYFYGVFKNAAKTSNEVVKVEARSTDSFTIAAGGRGADGTTAQTWTTADYFELCMTQAALAEVFNAAVFALGTLTPAADKFGYFTSATAAALADLSSYARTVLDDASADTALQTLTVEKKGADVASASTLDLQAATGNLVDVTGTTSVTAITLSEGRERVVRFTGALTLTNGASLVLPGAQNITTAAGDFAVFRGYAAGVVRCVHYQRIAGTGQVLQCLPSTDAGSSTASTSLTNMTGSNQSITPKSAASKILVEVQFKGTEAVATGVNTQATYRLYDVTNATYIGSANVLSAAAESQGAAAQAPCCLRALVSNAAVTARSFLLHGMTNDATAAASATDQVWSLTEILN